MPFNDLIRQNEPAAEAGQASLRIIIMTAVVFYILSLIIFIDTERYNLYSILYSCIIFLILSIFYRNYINKKPAISRRRRLIAMTADYTIIILCLSRGGEPMLPLYAVIAWITLGYGVRYGSYYLVAGNIMAITSLVIAFWFNHFWFVHPYLVAALLITVLLIPFYALVLLKRAKIFSEQALRATMAKSQLLSQVSHDLKQPVHAAGLFSLLLRNEEDAETREQLIHDIEESVAIISRTLNRILTMYHLDSSELKESPVTFSLEHLLNKIITTSSAGYPETCPAIYLENTAYQVYTDPTMLQSIVQNILSNARKYAPGDSIIIAAYRKKDKLILLIRDKGPGIPAEKLDNVFDEFYRINTDHREYIEGTGLGLSIVKRIAQASGLSVQIYSRPATGTCVCIGNIPVHEPITIRT